MENERPVTRGSSPPNREVTRLRKTPSFSESFSGRLRWKIRHYDKPVTSTPVGGKQPPKLGGPVEECYGVPLPRIYDTTLLSPIFKSHGTPSGPQHLETAKPPPLPQKPEIVPIGKQGLPELKLKKLQSTQKPGISPLEKSASPPAVKESKLPQKPAIKPVEKSTTPPATKNFTSLQPRTISLRPRRKAELIQAPIPKKKSIERKPSSTKPRPVRQSQEKDENQNNDISATTSAKDKDLPTPASTPAAPSEFKWSQYEEEDEENDCKLVLPDDPKKIKTYKPKVTFANPKPLTTWNSISREEKKKKPPKPSKPKTAASASATKRPKVDPNAVEWEEKINKEFAEVMDYPLCVEPEANHGKPKQK